jgi:hypothetical protein
VKVEVLVRRSLDHNPLLILTDGKGLRKKKMFRLNACWAKEKGFAEVINTSWKSGPRQGDTWANYYGKLQRCKRQIQIWAKKKEWASDGVIKEKSKELQMVQEEANPNEQQKEKLLKEELNLLMEQEEFATKGEGGMVAQWGQK